MMLFRIAALAFFFEWSLALIPLSDMDWSRQITLPPNCRTCQMMFDDHWIDESARSDLCWNSQLSLMLDSTSCQEAIESGDATTGYQLCAMSGACPSQRDFCMDNYDQAMLEPSVTMLETESEEASSSGPRATTNVAEYIPLTSSQKQSLLCQSFHTYFGIDFNACRGSFEQNSATADTFCRDNPYFTADDKGGLVDKVCNSPIHPIACHATNGVISQVPVEIEYSVVNADIGVSKTYHILDYCNVVQACFCNEGFTGADCSAVSPAFIDTKTKSIFAKRTRLANNQTLAHSHKEFPKLKPITLSSFKMGSAVNGMPDCNGDNWAYYQDDIDDSVGAGVSVETCGMAVRQSHDFLEVAILSQIGYTCQMASDCDRRTATGGCSRVDVCLGDVIINMETDGNGNHVPLQDAMAARKLFGVRATDKSDSSMSKDQVFSAAQFTAAGPLNAGWLMGQEYFDKYGWESNGGIPHTGGGIDSYDDNGLGYLGGEGLTTLIAGNKVGNVADRYVSLFEKARERSSPYYPYDDEYSQIDHDHFLDLGLDVDDLSANLNGFLDKCNQITYIKMERSAFPPEGGSMLMHNGPECFNDLSAAKFDLCPIISVTPTQSLTPSKSASMTPSPRGSEEGFNECTCFGEGEVGGFNTLALGDFTGGSDTEGKLGICGNAHLTSYSVGSKLGTTVDTTLMVNGDLTFPTGDVKFGNVKYGGNSYVGKSVRNGLFNGGQTMHKARWGMCDSYSAHFFDLAASLSNHASNGFTTQELRGQLIVHRASVLADGVVFLDVDCAELQKANHLKFSGVNVGETLVVNFRPFNFTEQVDGVQQTSLVCNLQKMQIDVADPVRTVFNFGITTEKITIDAVSIDASILAPLSSVIGKGGMINGQSVFGNFVGGTQQNLHPCVGCLDKAAAQPFGAGVMLARMPAF